MAITAATVLLRGPIADSLVVRGDANLYRGDLRAAVAHYRRALLFDGASIEAADRFLFVGTLTHSRSQIQDALNATRAVFSRNAPAKLYADRALCYLFLRDYVGAYRDFRTAAMIDGTATSLTFAGIAARRVHRADDARYLLRLALAKQPSYRPAAIALVGLR